MNTAKRLSNLATEADGTLCHGQVSEFGFRLSNAVRARIFTTLLYGKDGEGRFTNITL